MEPIHYYPDDLARSHYALLIKDGSHIIAVISLSWHRPKAFTQHDVRDLEFLAREVSQPIKWLKSANERLVDLEQKLELPAPGEAARLDYRDQLKQTLPLVAEMIGAHSAALYLPDRDDGRLVLARTDNRDDEFVTYNHDDAFVKALAAYRFERGEGLVGWIFKHRLPLNLHDVLDKTELAKVPDKLRSLKFDRIDLPEWVHLERFDNKHQSYLGVPIILGDETLGVIRFLKDATPTGFSYQDQQTLELVAERISRFLYLAYVQRIRAGAYTRLNCVITRPALTRETLAHEIFKIIQEGLGNCDCALRVLDEKTPGGSPGMRLIAAPPEWLVQLRAHRWRWINDPVIGEAWRTGQPRIIQDMKILKTQTATMKVTTDWFTKNYGTLAVFPLSDGHWENDPRRIVAILGVARRPGYPISMADHRFLERVAEMSGPYLAKTEADELVRFQLSVVDTALNEDVPHPAYELLGPIKAYAEAAHGWAWLARPDTAGYEMTDQQGRTLPGPVLDRETLHRLLAPPVTLGRSLKPLVPEGQAGKDVVAVALRSQDGQIIAAFALVPRQDCIFDLGRIENIQKNIDYYMSLFGKRYPACA